MKRFLRRNGAALTALAMLLVLVTVASQKEGKTIATGAWGLSFQTEGAAPLGNATPEALAAYDAVYLGDESQRVIYLTFDAGYENGYTAQILDVLQEHQVPAAFFLVGNYLEQNPELVRRMVNEGHIVGNHTYHHWDMATIGDEAVFRKELEDVEERFAEITGQSMAKFYRPPQGIYSEENLKMAQAMGYRTVFWSLAYVDWMNDAQPTSEQAFSKLVPRIHPGAVVLLHSTSRTNAQILDALLRQYEALGYTFGTLEDLFAARSDEIGSAG